MAGAGPHILTFYVIRLARPALDLDPPLRLDLEADFRPDCGGGGAGGGGGAAPPPASASEDGGDARGRFSARIDAASPLQALGLRGAPLALPPSFGPVYLGEQFACLVSLAAAPGGPAGGGAAAVSVRAELQTEGAGPITLYETGAGAPVPLLPPGGRHDFTLRHDVRALGPHTLVCTAAYTVAVSGERKHLAAYFKFTAAPPLAVRTKVRSVGPPSGQRLAVGDGDADDERSKQPSAAPGASGGAALVEATIDNLKVGPLCLDAPAFEPAPGLVATPVGCSGGGGGGGGAPAHAASSGHYPPTPPGGSASAVFLVTPAAPGAAMPPPGAPLGRLDLRWAGAMGARGRLQTQDVCAAPAAARAVALAPACLPAAAPLGRPFPITLRITSALDVPVGPLRLEAAGPPGAGGGDLLDGEEEGGGDGSAASPPARARASDGRPSSSSSATAGRPPAAPPPPPPAPPAVFLHGDARPPVATGAADGITLPPRGGATMTVHLVALAPGVHRLPPLRLVGEADGRVYDVLAGWVRVGEEEEEEREGA